MLGLQLRLASSRSSRKHDVERNKKVSKKSQVDQSVIVSVKSSDLYMKIHENMNMETVLHEGEEGKKKRERESAAEGGLGQVVSYSCRHGGLLSKWVNLFFLFSRAHVTLAIQFYMLLRSPSLLRFPWRPITLYTIRPLKTNNSSAVSV